MNATARTLESGSAAHAATLHADAASLAHDATTLATPSSGERFTPPASGTRTTVLPRVDGESGEVQLRLEARNRYEPVKLLGAGGMGEVVLVEDQDIARRVAVKRLRPEMTHPAVLARFIDEIRIVGRLEHPNIVPIHDVGVDELGRYFFVMKYVEGETLESIVDKLAAGDPEYLRKYTYEKRIEIFLGILNALAYAHAHGVIHRDIKPANVMVGRYGEVVVMDWGVAKALGSSRDPAAGADEGELSAQSEKRGRQFATRVGSIIGTPAYMSPEQARGENDRVDARSDLYSAAVLFHEMICLRHYLADATSLEGLLTTVGAEQRSFVQLASARHPAHSPPAELVHLVHDMLAIDPARRRYQTAEEMIAALQRIIEGQFAVQCHVTFTKRTARELGRLVDRRPHLAFFAFAGAVAIVILALVQVVRGAIA